MLWLINHTLSEGRKEIIRRREKAAILDKCSCASPMRWFVFKIFSDIYLGMKMYFQILLKSKGNSRNFIFKNEKRFSPDWFIFIWLRLSHLYSNYMKKKKRGDPSWSFRTLHIGLQLSLYIPMCFSFSSLDTHLLTNSNYHTVHSHG